MSLIPLGFWAASGGGAISYFHNTLLQATNTGTVVGSGVDSANNVYYATSLGGFYIAKLNAEGELQWQRRLGSATFNDVYVDPSGNVYLAGYAGSNGVFAKYNTNGTLQWQRSLANADFGMFNGIVADSSGNVYISGYTQIGSFNSAVIAKYNSSGTLQWQRYVSYSTSSSLGEKIALDSTGAVYVAARVTLPSPVSWLILKYDSSGGLQWQRSLVGVSNGSALGIVTDSSNNVYATGNVPSGTGVVAKWNSSGTLQWQRTLSGGSSDDPRRISADSLDNVYITGSTYSDGAGSIDWLVAKYNSSGTIQWQRTVGGTGSDNGGDISFDSNNSMFLAGASRSVYSASTPTGGLSLKLPNDGSLTGSYSINTGTVVYQASALTDAAGTLTGTTPTTTSSASSLTSSTTSLTDAAGTLTSSTTII